MKDASPRTIYLKDYQAPDFAIDTTQLYFELYEDYSEVTARLVISRSAENVVPQLVLDGQDLKLLSISINDCELAKDAYEIGEETLTLNFDKVIVEGFSQQNFILETKVRIEPQNNTSLEGLYKSRTMFCTQCEAEGFRKITYYLDRPDALSEFTTRIYADKSRYPVLLSNGNPVASGDLDGGRHWAEWHDPFKKPCYLFALVAGDLVAVDDEFKTQSGRDVLLRIFVEEKDRDKCDHAMRSLKNAMLWDEDVYGREYDLDIFMIVAVDDFNMGAMENKGLNIFNTSCVLANEKTTTDAGFQRVEGVVAHEYFHNWSGNRVTCRDWFQLSLKEGFTVFRDEEFSADMGSATVKRVEDVSLLRTNQFAEDASPMAHPVQPSSFIEISNFYTLTIYEKGAEVVRMIRTLLGPALFRKGSDLYFDRHDGCAVTIEDFIAAMADVSGRDFSHFMLWYQQAGTPKLKVTGDYNQTEKTYTLKVQQSCPATPESATKKPFLIPLDAALIGEQGRIAPSKVLEVSKEQETFVFHDVAERPVPSLLRGFSAPVNLDFAYSLDDLTRLMARDDDGFCRWDASQKMAIQVINNVIVSLANDPAPTVDKRYLDAFGEVLNQAITSLKNNDQTLDLAMIALMLQLPSEEYIAQQHSVVDVDSIHHARARVKRKLATTWYEEILAGYEYLNVPEIFAVDAASIARRTLKNTLLSYLVTSGREQAIDICALQLATATNMTDEIAALTALTHSPSRYAVDQKGAALASFYSKWSDEALVVNQWFAVQATAPLPTTLNQVEELMKHPAFDANNPNKLRALVAGFCMRNPIAFHERKGKGYRFLADQIIQLNARNPQIAARLLTPLTRWRNYDEQRQGLMREQLKRISVTPKLSKDVFEVVTKSL